MITTLTGTDASSVDKKLVSMRQSGGAIALGRVLTLLIVADAEHLDEPLAAAVQASHEHPCRVLVLVAEPDAATDGLDAEIRVGGDAGTGEIVILRARGQVTTSLDTLVTPLLLPDAPIVTWWPGTSPSCPSQDVLGSMSQRRITDARRSENPDATLKRLRLGYTSGDSDLAWSRLTSWRGLVATAYELPPVSRPHAVTVHGIDRDPSVLLMAAWLETALGVTVTVEAIASDEPGLSGVTLHRSDGDVSIQREDAESLLLRLPGNTTDQHVTMPRRSLYECLSEELRRLDPDEVYGDVLRHAFGGIVDAGMFAESSPEPTDEVSEDATELATDAAAQVASHLAEAIAQRGIARLVLTGGTVGVATAASLVDAFDSAGVQAADLELWWGDERFVAGGDSQRNDEQVRPDLLDKLDIPEHQVHRMPATGDGMGLDDAAAWYGQQLDMAGGDLPFRTRGEAFFDVVLLGMGPDGHIASLFPEHPDQRESVLAAIPVRHSPKPPVERISLTWPALNSARHVLFLVAGEEKARAVKRAHRGIDPWRTPASAVRGTVSTTWHLDRAAASKL